MMDGEGDRTRNNNDGGSVDDSANDVDNRDNKRRYRFLNQIFGWQLETEVEEEEEEEVVDDDGGGIGNIRRHNALQGKQKQQQLFKHRPRWCENNNNSNASSSLQNEETILLNSGGTITEVPPVLRSSSSSCSIRHRRPVSRERGRIIAKNNHPSSNASQRTTPGAFPIAGPGQLHSSDASSSSSSSSLTATMHYLDEHCGDGGDDDAYDHNVDNDNDADRSESERQRRQQPQQQQEQPEGHRTNPRSNQGNAQDGGVGEILVSAYLVADDDVEPEDDDEELQQQQQQQRQELHNDNVVTPSAVVVMALERAKLVEEDIEGDRYYYYRNKRYLKRHRSATTVCFSVVTVLVCCLSLLLIWIVLPWSMNGEHDDDYLSSSSSSSSSYGLHNLEASLIVTNDETQERIEARRFALDDNSTVTTGYMFTWSCRPLECQQQQTNVVSNGNGEDTDGAEMIKGDRCIADRFYEPGCCVEDDGSGRLCNETNRCGLMCRPNVCRTTSPKCKSLECLECDVAVVEGANKNATKPLYSVQPHSYNFDCLRTGTSYMTLQSNEGDRKEEEKEGLAVVSNITTAAQTSKTTQEQQKQQQQQQQQEHLIHYRWAIVCGYCTSGCDTTLDIGIGEYLCMAAREPLDAVVESNDEQHMIGISAQVPCQYIQLGECGCGPLDAHDLGLGIRPTHQCQTEDDCPYLCKDAGIEHAKDLCNAFDGGIDWWEGQNFKHENVFVYDATMTPYQVKIQMKNE